MSRVGVCLSGCGVFDGSEIHESVLALLALDRAGVEVLCMAPNAPQHHVIDHLTGEPADETRNVLVESARIARGKITDVAEVSGAEVDALILPGGFGAAKNLCDFAVAGADARAHPEVQRLIREVHGQGKPIGAICISPAVVAAAFQGTDVTPTLTIGDDAETAAALEGLGASHMSCPVDEFRVDRANRIVTTPAYMYDAGIGAVAQGIERLVAEVVGMLRTDGRS